MSPPAPITDTDRMNHVEKAGQGKRWIARPSALGRGYRLHNCEESDFPRTFATAREAIDDAIMEGREA